ncbi:MAG TPA: metallopeptidase TldD-related protein, partial [Rhizomicrobium sp.]
MTKKRDPHTTLDDLIRAARSAGADAADAILIASVAASVSYRLGRLEELERAESWDLGLRVFAGERVAFVSSTDLSRETLEELPARALAMARLAPRDKFACLAPADRLARSWPALDLEDPNEPSADALIERARTIEGAAMAVPGITNSEGGGASFGRSEIALATSEGFFGRYAGTSHAIGAAVLAGEGAAMERDYDSVSARHSRELESPEDVGRRAGERAVARLNPRKARSQAVPVIFEPRVASGLLGHFAGAISGAAIARGVSFLKDSLAKEVFASGIEIVDDPHRVRGLR